MMFSMTYHHKYSVGDVERMVPFERDIYLSMIKKHIEETEKDQ
jgi:hypothetical protein